jgi:hypothetical protein
MPTGLMVTETTMTTNNGFDSASFWAGTFVGILFLALVMLFVSAVDGYDYRIGISEACQYAEDLCYPEYEDGRWSIVQGER